MKSLISIVTLCLIAFSLSAQTSGGGLWLGVANYTGDLSHGFLNLRQTRPALGVYGQYGLTPRFALRGGLGFGWIAGNDKFATSDALKQRNLQFRSAITDAHIALQFDILSPETAIIQPYLFAGIGLFHFNPKAQYEGEWVELQPLGTEGQGLNPNISRFYRLTQLNIPAGMGVRYAWRENLYFGLEFSYRKTFTDYIDDVSGVYYDLSELLDKRGATAADLADRLSEYTNNPDDHFETGTERGNSSAKDGYGFFAVSASYLISTGKKKSAVGCTF